MTAYQKRQRPRCSGAEAAERMAMLYGKDKSTRLPDNWRDRLPNPAGYYATAVDKLGRPNGSGWAQGKCPFHDDHNASLSLHVAGERGHYRCFACGEHGDMVTFHQKRSGLQFREAVADLLGARR